LDPSRLARTLMVFGTASDAGKSTLTAGLCRVWARQGLRVAPFKAQNMARNAYVCADGGEIGVAQAVQALAAQVSPSIDHNPILLKPEPGLRSQLIVLGRSLGSVQYRELWRRRPELLQAVDSALGRLRVQHDLVVLEGAGSPAEINLHAHDIANLYATRAADARAILVADIDRGGAFAAMVGTLELLPDDVRERMCGLVFNKFRGDASLLADGIEFLERRTGLPVLGVVPHAGELGLPDEDSLAQSRYRGRARAGLNELEIAIVDTPYLANFEDFIPLSREPQVRMRLTAVARELLEADLVILAGSKATTADLAFLRRTGLDQALLQRAARQLPMLGICGGAQLLGLRIEDPEHVESDQACVEALGLMAHITRYEQPKRTHQCRGQLHALGAEVAVTGFMLHHGRLCEVSGAPALTLEDGTPEGHAQGALWASMLHRIFDAAPARAALLSWLRARRSFTPVTPADAAESAVEDDYDRLANHISAHIDCNRLLQVIRASGPSEA